MDAFETIVTKLDIRDFSAKPVPVDVKTKILESARSTGTGMNTQHWRFLLVEEPQNIKKLAEDSSSGRWVAKANFAVVILTSPKYGFHLIDVGRAAQNMQVAAWNFGVVSGIYTGVNAEAMRRDFAIPADLNPTAVLAFGYPTKKITGKRKNRLPLSQLAYAEKYGNPIDSKKIGVKVPA